ncbi:MAG: cobalt ECF transporter T component CbiQ [Candidatus Caldatribacteriaceae bacterium]
MFLEAIVHTNRLYNVHPRDKVLFTIWAMIFAFTNDLLSQLFILGIVTFVLLVIARVPFKAYIRFLITPFTFLIFSTLVIILSQGSYIEGFKIFFRSITVFSALAFLVMTTPVTELLIFLRRLRVSPLFIELSFLTYRYIFLLDDFVSNALLAQEARLGYSSFRRRLHSISLLVSALFIWMFQTIEEIKIGLSVRGYEGGKIEFVEEMKYCTHRGYLLSIFVLVVCSMLLRFYSGG